MGAVGGLRIKGLAAIEARGRIEAPPAVRAKGKLAGHRTAAIGAAQGCGSGRGGWPRLGLRLRLRLWGRLWLRRLPWPGLSASPGLLLLWVIESLAKNLAHDERRE